jgi:hypothetical protein
MTGHVGYPVHYLADHSLLLAIPAFFPAVVVVGVVIFVARRDRRQDDPNDDLNDEASPDAAQIEQSGSADHDGSP